MQRGRQSSVLLAAGMACGDPNQQGDKRRRDRWALALPPNVLMTKREITAHGVNASARVVTACNRHHQRAVQRRMHTVWPVSGCLHAQWINVHRCIKASGATCVGSPQLSGCLCSKEEQPQGHCSQPEPSTSLGVGGGKVHEVALAARSEDPYMHNFAPRRSP